MAMMRVYFAAISLLLCFGSAVGLGDAVCDDRDLVCPGSSKKKLVHAFGNHVGIANREARTISLVHPYTLETTLEYEIPDNGEPMYFAMVRIKPEIWVGDRANNRIVIFRMKGCNLELDEYLDAPAGVFHTMMTQRRHDHCPIVVTTCDIDNVIIVHDVITRKRLATIGRPQEAEKFDMKPHDTTTNGEYIFVSFVAPTSTDDTDFGFVASYDAHSFELIEVLRTPVADPHMAIRDNTNLFIAAQGSDNGGLVMEASVPDLSVIGMPLERPSPHGTFISYDCKYLYTTNIAEGGAMAIETWEVHSGRLMDCPEVVTTTAVPHNPTVSFDGDMIYVTHSGGESNINSAFRIRHDGCVDPKSEVRFKTNLNPFGLFIIPPAQCTYGY